MSLRLFMFAALGALTSMPAAALEVIGEAPYLENRYRAVWRSAALSTVLKEIEKQTAPLVQSDGVSRAVASAQAVTLIDEDKERLRDTLERLERTQDLHITAEPLRLFVETWTDYRDRKRHLVNLALRDYGLFIDPPDFVGPELGYERASGGSGGGGFSLFASGDGHHSAGRKPDPVEVVEWLQKLATDTSASLRGNGNVHIKVTDEEEVAIRAALTEVQNRLLQRTSWRVTFGTLPADQTLPTGMTTNAEAEAMRGRLQAPRVLSLSALNAQRVHAIDGHQQALIDDIDVVNYQYDPRPSVLATGVAADIRPVIGSQFIHLSYHLSWVDPQPAATSTMINPPRLKVGQTSTTTTTTSKESPKETGKTDVPAKEHTTTSTSTSNEGGDIRPGTMIPLTKPVLWTWKPIGETMLPRDRAIVLATEHPAGTAVMVVEILP